MPRASAVFSAVFLICLPSFLPLPPHIPFLPTRIAAAIIVTACALLSFSTAKATSDNEVVISPPSSCASPPRACVIILGWGGARRRHLRRLEEWYHSQASITLSYTAPFSVFFYSSNGACLQQLAAAACEHAARGQVKLPLLQPTSRLCFSLIHPQRIIVHLHSNTGAFTFAALLACCPTLRPDAVVWDSAPAWSPALEPALLKCQCSAAAIALALSRCNAVDMYQAAGGAAYKLRQLLYLGGTAAMQVRRSHGPSRRAASQPSPPLTPRSSWSRPTSQCP